MHKLALRTLRARSCRSLPTFIFFILTLVLLFLLLPFWPRDTHVDFSFQIANIFKDDGLETLPREVWTRLLYVPGHERSHSELCPAYGLGISLVVLVVSAPGNKEAREAIRSTWGLAARHANVTLAFMLGAPPDHLREVIDLEDARFKDLIQARFLDSYGNLTLKSISNLEWFATYCPFASRFFKTDDDTFFNIEELLNFVYEHNGTNTIWAEVVDDATPIRDKRFKYFTPEIEFPGALYPPFPVGHGYLISSDAVHALLSAAPDARFLRLEDVFMGILAARAGVSCVHAQELLPMSADKPCDIRRTVCLTNIRYHEQFDRYAKLLDPDTACSIEYEDTEEINMLRNGS